MTRDRHCVIGVLLTAGVGFAAWPVAADSQGPANDVLGGVQRAPDVVGQVQQKLPALRAPSAAPGAGSAPAQQGSPRPAAPSRPAAPTTGQRAPSTTGHVVASGRASRAASGSASGAGQAQASGSSRSSTPAAKASGAGTGRSSRSVTAVQSAARPAVTSPGSHVQNRADMPFTGFEVLRVAVIGLLALATGSAMRFALRRRSLT